MGKWAKNGNISFFLLMCSVLAVVILIPSSETLSRSYSRKYIEVLNEFAKEKKEEMMRRIREGLSNLSSLTEKFRFSKEDVINFISSLPSWDGLYSDDFDVVSYTPSFLIQDPHSGKKIRINPLEFQRIPYTILFSDDATTAYLVCKAVIGKAKESKKNGGRAEKNMSGKKGDVYEGKYIKELRDFMAKAVGSEDKEKSSIRGIADTFSPLFIFFVSGRGYIDYVLGEKVPHSEGGFLEPQRMCVPFYIYPEQARKFGITRIPAIVRQKGRKFQIIYIPKNGRRIKQRGKIQR